MLTLASNLLRPTLQRTAMLNPSRDDRAVQMATLLIAAAGFAAFAVTYRRLRECRRTSISTGYVSEEIDP